ncbi:hypothetical protein TUMSATVNIG1_57690 (plasmid) [Vibrio nigripulchritudo]|nr:hypothetical protein VNTUMSATTG_57200 [Vibrio nigripulchritudo]BDU35160.1 hypothetical protein TUMSATVNIG1_57690 [Vibrio nigripulchritudo]
MRKEARCGSKIARLNEIKSENEILITSVFSNDLVILNPSNKSLANVVTSLLFLVKSIFSFINKLGISMQHRNDDIAEITKTLE